MQGRVCPPSKVVAGRAYAVCCLERLRRVDCSTREDAFGAEARSASSEHARQAA